MTGKAWLERLPELAKGYAPRDVVKMDEFGVFSKALHEKGLRQTRK